MMNPYLVQTEMKLRVGQHLREAKHRGLVRASGANNGAAFGSLLDAASAGFRLSAGPARNAANAIRTWYGKVADPQHECC
jgi:hypothetical protein